MPENNQQTTKNHQVPLGKSGWTYLRVLAAEYDTIPAGEHLNAGAAALANRAKQQLLSGAADWNDVHDLEVAILELQSTKDLQRRAWSLREDYRAAIGDTLFKTYMSSLPQDLDTADGKEKEKELRADLRRVLSELHRMRTLDRARNEARKKSLWYALLGLLIVVVFVLSATSVAFRTQGRHMRWVVTSMNCGLPSMPAKPAVSSGQAAAQATSGEAPVAQPQPKRVAQYPERCLVAILPLVILFGGLGGFLSAMQRINSETGSSVKSLENAPAWPIALASPTGAIGAVAFYLILSGGFISGSLFPSVDHFDADAPLHYLDFAKLMLWAFVAGFSERLVPDALDWLSQSGVGALRASNPLPAGSTAVAPGGGGGGGGAVAAAAGAGAAGAEAAGAEAAEPGAARAGGAQADVAPPAPAVGEGAEPKVKK